MSAVPPLTLPINLNNIGAYVGLLIASVSSLAEVAAASRADVASFRATVIADLQLSLSNEMILLQSGDVLRQNQETMLQEIDNLESALGVLTNSLANTTNVLTVAVQGLGNVATANLQQQEIALLEQILRIVSLGAPVSQGVDFANVSATRNPNPPTRPGP